MVEAVDKAVGEIEKAIWLARESPDEWIEQAFGCRLWLEQKEIARSVFRNARTVVRSCEGSGKSFIAARVALCFLYNYSPSTVITTAPTWRQIEQILWREIAVAWNSRKLKLAGHLTSARLDIADDWFAIGISTDQPERFQGFHNENVLVVGDESSGLSDGVYQAIENPLSTGHTRLLLIGNPTQPMGKFKEAFESNLYHHIHISAFNTPNFAQFGITIEDIRGDTWKAKCGVNEADLIDGGWRKKVPFPSLTAPPKVAERYKEWGEKSFAFQVYVMGEFPAVGEQNLFQWADIEAAVNRELVAEGDLVAGLDISRYGDNETVFVRRMGNKVLGIDGWSRQDILFTTGRVVRLCRQYGTPQVIRIDATAIGQDDTTLLTKEGYNCDAVFVGQPAVDTERFANRRAELYWLLSKKFIDGSISIPNDRILMAQLADIRFTYTGKGKLIMESKEEIRARGSKSPDRADALMLSFIPVGKKGQPKWRQF